MMMPETARLGELVDAPPPCRHKNVNPFILERIAARPNAATPIPARVHLRCPVEECDNHWYLAHPEGQLSVA
jgi:hypothetical protein